MNLFEKVAEKKDLICYPTNTNWRLEGASADVARGVQLLNEALGSALQEYRQLRRASNAQIRDIFLKSISQAVTAVNRVGIQLKCVRETVALFCSVHVFCDVYDCVAGELVDHLPEVLPDPSETSLTLNNYILGLRQSVALPLQGDMTMFGGNPEEHVAIARAYQEELSQVLLQIRTERLTSRSVIADRVLLALFRASRTCHDVHLLMGDAQFDVAAYFFAYNWHPVLFAPICELFRRSAEELDYMGWRPS